MEEGLLSPAAGTYRSLGPETPVALLRRLRSYQTVRAILRRAPARWWLSRWFIWWQAGAIFSAHWFLYPVRDELHKSGGALLPGAAIVSWLVPFAGSLSMPCTSNQCGGSFGWMSAASETVLMHGGCCGVRRDEKGRQVYNQLNGCPSILSAFGPALRRRGLCGRSVMLALLCFPLGLASAFLLMLGVNATNGCPLGSLADAMGCPWSRLDASAFLGAHALTYNMWVSILCLVGFLLEDNLSSATIAKMFRAQHGEGIGEDSVQLRNDGLKTPAGMESRLEAGRARSPTC